MGTGLALETGAQHHEVGSRRRERVVVHAEAAHRLRREVLRDRVGPLEREALGDLDGSRVLHVEGDAELADVQRVEHVAALEPVRVLGGQRVGAQEVRPGLGFHLDDRGAVLGEVTGGDGARGTRPELEDPGASPRAALVLVALDHRHGGWARQERRGVRGGVGPRPRTCGRGAPHLHERQREARHVAVGTEEAAGRELPARVQLAWRVGRGEHQVGVAGDLVELGHRARREVARDRCLDGPQLVVGDGVVVVGRPVARAQGGVAEPGVLQQAGDQLEVRDPRLAAPQPERHEAVGAGPDLACAAHSGARSPAPEPGAGEAAGRTHAGHEDDLLHRDVDALRPARCHPGERGEGRLGPGVRVRGRLGATHRWPIGVARRVHVARRRHHPEVRRPPRRAGSPTPERSDAHPYRRGGACGVEVEGARPARRVDHDVGVREQLVERVVVRCDRHQPFARVPRDPVDGPAAASARHACHVGAQIAEDARGHLGGLAGQVEHAEAVEQAL